MCLCMSHWKRLISTAQYKHALRRKVFCLKSYGEYSGAERKIETTKEKNAKTKGRRFLDEVNYELY